MKMIIFDFLMTVLNVSLFDFSVRRRPQVDLEEFHFFGKDFFEDEARGADLGEAC